MIHGLDTSLGLASFPLQTDHPIKNFTDLLIRHYPPWEQLSLHPIFREKVFFPPLQTLFTACIELLCVEIPFFLGDVVRISCPVY